MGPDEFATREELGLILKLFLAKIQQQTEARGKLSELLIDKGIITDAELVDLVHRLGQSPASVRSKLAWKNLRSFLTMHNIVTLYEDPPPEDT